MVETFGTGNVTDERITELVREHFDLRPYGILRMLDLLNAERIKYRKTAAYGHFGREDEGFSWEQTDKADELREAAGLRE
jgi:S-adenosylmethionine synthetase